MPAWPGPNRAPSGGPSGAQLADTVTIGGCCVLSEDPDRSVRHPTSGRFEQGQALACEKAVATLALKPDLKGLEVE